MSAGVFFVVGVALYVAFLATTAYYCAFADPEESPLAKLLTKTIPEKCWQGMKKMFGPRSLSVIEFFMDRALIIFYCFIIFGSWSIIFSYIYQWADHQEYLPHYHKYIGYMVFGACIMSWRQASNTSPGIITATNIERYDHFPYDDIMFVAGQMCPTRNIRRLARSKFDRIKYKENVARFDHYCGWVHNTIGEENYRWFLLFLLVHVLMCAYGTYTVSKLFYGEILDKKLLTVTFFDRYTGEEIHATKWIIFQYLFNRHLLESAVFSVMVVMSVALGMFLLYHVWLTSRGLTTNESYKWDQVKRWYHQELNQYNKAVKKGEISIAKEKQTSRKPTISDSGDVTCVSGGDFERIPTKEGSDKVVHPGPPPKNIYNRGIVENWKEVIFPLSLRKGESKSKAT